MGHHRDAPISVSRIPGARASTSSRLAGPPSATWPRSRTCATSAVTSTSTATGQRRTPTPELYHFIGKGTSLTSTAAFLAGHAGRRELPQADQGQRTLCDRQRRQDVQVQGHLHQASTYLKHLIRSACATTTRRQAQQPHRRSGPEPEDFCLSGSTPTWSTSWSIWLPATPALSPSVLTGKLTATCAEPELYGEFANARAAIAGAYESREFSRAIRESWRWPTRRTATWTTRHPGHRQAGKGLTPNCRKSVVGINLFQGADGLPNR